MSKEKAASIAVEPGASAPAPTQSPPAQPTPSSEPQNNHKRSDLVMPNDTTSAVIPLCLPPASNDDIPCQSSKTRPPLPIDPIDLASIARLEARGLPAPGQSVKVDSVFKPLSRDEIDNLMKQRKVRTSVHGNYEHSTSLPVLAKGPYALEHELQGTDKMRGEEELEDGLEEIGVSNFATAGLVNDGWRVTKGLAVVKGDVERPTAK